MSLPLDQVAQRLQGSVTRLSDVRERHLNAAVNEVLGARTRVLPDPRWPSLGRSGVDVVVGDPPTLVAELKWNQVAQDKIYEGIWDLFKVGNLAAQRGCEAWLITGATERTWASSWCTDLLTAGSLTARELCGRRFPRGSQWFAWQNLLDGGAGRAPRAVPEHLDLLDARTVALSDGTGSWELRAVRVRPSRKSISMPGGWPGKRFLFMTRAAPAPVPRPTPVPEQRHPQLDALDRRAGAFLDHARDELASRLPAEVVSQGGVPRDFLTRRLSFIDRTGRRTAVRLGVAPETSTMNAPGLGASFFAGVEHDSSGRVEADAIDAIEAAGFPAMRTNGGYPAHWRHLDLDDVLANQRTVIAQLADDICATGLLRP